MTGRGRTMPKPEEMFKQGDPSMQIVNLLYNTGFRLTGAHRKTQELLKDVFNDINDIIDINTALKNLCLIYRNKAITGWGIYLHLFNIQIFLFIFVVLFAYWDKFTRPSLFWWAF